MGRKSTAEGQLSCSFCGKGQREVRKLIAGPTVFICDECVRLCTDIIEEELEASPSPKDLKALPKPQEIVAFLDRYVVGQHHTKKSLAVAVYNHYKRLRNDSDQTSPTPSSEPVEIQKSNVLMVGPTGTGKTLLAQSLARLLDVPFTIADATTLTEAGYVGEDVENILAGLLTAADNDIERAQRGIVYIDEIDKIARKTDSPHNMRDVSGEGVQQALLKIIEGTRANVPLRGSRKYGQTETVALDTRNILVICAGSFTGLEKIIERRLGKRSLGFGAPSAEVVNTSPEEARLWLRHLQPEDLQNFGLIPEFIGRLPVLATLDPLTLQDLKRVLTEPKNALIRQYQRLFAFENVDLEFEDEAVAAVAQKAIDNKSGARGLRAILEESMLDLMYEVLFMPHVKACSITADVVAQRGLPKLRFAK